MRSNTNVHGHRLQQPNNGNRLSLNHTKNHTCSVQSPVCWNTTSGPQGPVDSRLIKAPSWGANLGQDGGGTKVSQWVAGASGGQTCGVNQSAGLHKKCNAGPHLLLAKPSLAAWLHVSSAPFQQHNGAQEESSPPAAGKEAVGCLAQRLLAAIQQEHHRCRQLDCWVGDDGSRHL